MLSRPAEKSLLEKALARNPVVGLVGPRQCGKTTLAREFLPLESPNYFDLEDPVQLARLDEPKLALEPLEGLVVIDEVQRKPELFPLLRVLADRSAKPAQFLILGSAGPELLRQTSETLAGRIEYIELSGLRLSDVPQAQQDAHWQRGGFPRSLLAFDEESSNAWRQNFIQTFLERDLAQLGIDVSATTMRRFWIMLAHYHGQIVNVAELARSLSASQPKVQRYLDILSSVFMVRLLQPWHENLKKRQVKRPKLYIRDSGLLHSLLGIEKSTTLLTHPKLGASWEGYALEEILKTLPGWTQAYFWATHGGAELDLLIERNGQRLGFEFKRQDAPKLSKSMQSAMEDLSLDRLDVIYPGKQAYPLAKNIEVWPLEDWLKTHA